MFHVYDFFCWVFLNTYRFNRVFCSPGQVCDPRPKELVFLMPWGIEAKTILQGTSEPASWWGEKPMQFSSQFLRHKKNGRLLPNQHWKWEVSHVVEVSKFSWVFLSNSLWFIIEFEPICKQKNMEIHDLLAKVLGLYISSETVWGSESIFSPIAVWTSADEVEVSSTWGFKDSQTHHESLWQASKQKHTNVIWRECSFWRCSLLTKLAEIACETKIVDFLSSGTRHGIMEPIIETKQKMQEMATSAAWNSDLLQTSNLPCSAYVLFF